METADLQPEDLQPALSATARAIAESLDIRDVWQRVAEACRAVVPSDAMGVSQLLRDDQVRILVAAGHPAAEGLLERVLPREAFSPRLWPRGERFLVVISDATKELDPAFAMDRELIELGFRSILRLPLGHGDPLLGSLILVARTPGRFEPSHGQRLTVVAELVAVALSHQQLANTRREQRQRRDALERLVPALTDSLDVRDVFEKVASVAQEVVPHDYLSLSLVSPDRKRVRIHARHGVESDVRDVPEGPVPDEIQALFDLDCIVTVDTTLLGGRRLRLHFADEGTAAGGSLDISVDDFFLRLYAEYGMRCALRAAVRLNGVAVGGLEFNSRQPGRYGPEDAAFAVRIAEHIALALAHQQLAEEGRRVTAAQDRADQLQERVYVLAQELEARTPHRALGRSRQWRDVLAQAGKVAPTDTTVLITGESGTGKEVVARFVHRASARKDGPFVALNCAALPEQLLESELFGHEKGAFTGALAARPGKIEQAAGGVLFLDEVGEMSPAVQAKFLRVLQEREYQRLGGSRTLKADVRVLAATNRNLKAAIGQGGFREDLYYRLAVFDVPLPALRERPEDIELLAESFLEEIGRSVGRPAAGLSEEVRDKLVAYPWPGNVRELRNAIERAVILCEGGLVTSEHLPIGIAATPRTVPSKPAPPASPVPSTLDAAEREMIVQALTRAGNNKSKAARILGLTRAQLRSRIEKHGLATED